MEQKSFKHALQGFMQASEVGNLEAIKKFLGCVISLDAR
jgi:hypothetical protein